MSYKIFFLGLTVVLFTACGGGGSTNATDTPTAKETAIAHIKAYAQDGATAPTLQDYLDAGVTGVTVVNLDDINEAVENLTAEDVDTTQEIQALADELGVVVDTTKPVITLLGDATVSLTVGDIYTEQGASATDDVDGNITDDINTTGEVDTDLAGMYILKYNVKDSAGNVANEVMRTVTVEPQTRQLKKTGQTTSYNASGTEVTDGSIKDDGFYQKGTTASYTRDDATDIVTDHITNLQWADDSNASNGNIRKPWLTTSNYDICRGQNGQTQDTSKCTDTSGDTATTYCSSLTLGEFSDWRLPSIDELMYIADRSKVNPPIDTIYFKNVASNNYWSSTAVVGNEYYAWGVDFNYGSDGWYRKSDSSYVRCVRDGQP